MYSLVLAQSTDPLFELAALGMIFGILLRIFMFFGYLVGGVLVVRHYGKRFSERRRLKMLAFWTVWCIAFPLLSRTSLSILLNPLLWLNPITLFWSILWLPRLYSSLFIWGGIGLLWIIGTPIILARKV
jgi:hypothetical protein